MTTRHTASSTTSLAGPRARSLSTGPSPRTAVATCPQPRRTAWSATRRSRVADHAVRRGCGQVATAVLGDGPVLKERALGPASDVVEDAVWRVVIGAEDSPAARPHRPRREGDLGKGVLGQGGRNLGATPNHRSRLRRGDPGRRSELAFL